MRNILPKQTSKRPAPINMKFLFEEFSNGVFTGKSEKGWKKFGVEQFLKLTEFLGVKPDEKFIESVESKFSYEKVPNHTIVVEKGKISDKLYFILKGTAKQISYTGDKEKVSGLYDAGNILASTQSVFGSKKSQIEIVTCEACRILTLPAKDLFSIYFSDTSGKWKELQHAMFLKTLQFLTDYSNFITLTSEERLQFMVDNYPGIFENFKLKDIASFSGMKAETMSRSLAKMKSIDPGFLEKG